MLLLLGLVERYFAVHLLLVEVSLIVVAPENNLAATLDDKEALVSELSLSDRILALFDESVL
jgi:hypothetical protein